MTSPLAIPLLAVDIGGEIGKHWSLGPNPSPGALVAGILHLDTLISTLIVMALLLIMALYVRANLTSGVPKGWQNALEIVLEFLTNMARDLVGEQGARVIMPLAFPLGLFILVSNWIGLLPTGGRLKSPTSDMNTTFALSFSVILYVWYRGIRARGGAWFRTWLNPLTWIEEIPKPIVLSLRLFGNIAAGEILLILVGALPAVLIISPIPTAAWVGFSIFIGGVQAFVFVILTIAYYGTSTGTVGH
ncbi:MAG TPA: F0F1 ATP synthase subunit A [Chloroflexota bacterium]|nr:F0F1 ATP synthase subunit A [Chloroflexota bacterium]